MSPRRLSLGRLLIVAFTSLASCTIELVDQDPNAGPPACGDGVADAGEVCDDGNNINGDGCSELCDSDELCGNGILDVQLGEQCDNGTGAASATCDGDCTAPQCGDGFLNLLAGELCDDGNNLDGDGCSADCHTTAACGNGVVDAGELCDPGFGGSTPGCDADCTLPLCGDGLVNVPAGEQCDPGFFGSTATCDHDCTVALCGDGFVNVAAGEQCDDGNVINNDTCRNDCTLP